MCPTLLYASKRFRFVCAYGAILPTIIENALNIVYVPLKEVFQIACQWCVQNPSTAILGIIVIH
jgi:hypothetical protein